MNKIQKLILELVRNTKFNKFDGERIAKDLEENEDKWLGFIFGRWIFWQLIPLRDIDSGLFNADTIYIKVKKENLDWLKRMAQKWEADEFGYVLNGEVKGIIDENLYGLVVEKKEIPIYFQLPLGASPEKDIAYARLWWD